ncbi:hypothetical protein HY634_03065 [Candidatus Uhrbacteria bacterium]|nr:hypothetical protein [Candidatus Uhrbacteria bacterium]
MEVTPKPGVLDTYDILVVGWTTDGRSGILKSGMLDGRGGSLPSPLIRISVDVDAKFQTTNVDVHTGQFVVKINGYYTTEEHITVDVQLLGTDIVAEHVHTVDKSLAGSKEAGMRFGVPIFLGKVPRPAYGTVYKARIPVLGADDKGVKCTLVVGLAAGDTDVQTDAEGVAIVSATFMNAHREVVVYVKDHGAVSPLTLTPEDWRL